MQNRCVFRLREQLEPRHCLSAVALIEHELLEAEPGASGRYPTTILSDIDGDADLDVLISLATRNQGDQINFWFENTNNGTFLSRHDITALDGSAQSMASSDMDSDGDQDLLVAASNEVIAWLENEDGLGSFGRANVIASHPTIHDSYYIEAADVNSDGNLDVVSAWSLRFRLWIGASLSWYGNFEGAIAPGQVITEDFAAAFIYDVHPVDVDQDNDVDFIFTKKYPSWGDNVEDNGVYWAENIDGEGALGDEQLIAPIIGKTVVVDIDNDSDLDVVSAGETLQWFAKADADDRFETSRVIASPANPILAIEAGDLDSDGDVDLIVHSATPQFTISWYENLDGIGGFSNEQLLFQSSLHYVPEDGLNSFTRASVDMMHLGDIDGNGRLDLAIALSESGVSWFENRLIGDSNDDSIFDSSDFVKVFQAAKYEDDIPGNATFDEGDWNQDGDFDSSDFVFAFQTSDYVAAARPLFSSFSAVDSVFTVDDEDERMRWAFVP